MWRILKEKHNLTARLMGNMFTLIASEMTGIGEYVTEGPFLCSPSCLNRLFNQVIL